MSQEVVVEVFGNGLFGENKPDSNNQQLAQLVESKFNHVILWSVHVRENGDLYYNDTPLVTGGVFNSDLQYMIPYVQSLSKTAQIYWGIGSWGASDFKNIGNLLKTPEGTKALSQNLAGLLEAVPATGIDFDMEESYDEEMRNTVVQFTLMLHNQFSIQVTYCPYTQELFWLNCLADVYDKAGQQLVARFNLQCYAGGGGNTTAQWLSTLNMFDRPLGIADVNTFIVPSFWVQTDDGSQKYSPADICKFFGNPAIRENAGGGFLWNTSEMFQSGYEPTDYANAVLNGLADACD